MEFVDEGTETVDGGQTIGEPVSRPRVAGSPGFGCAMDRVVAEVGQVGQALLGRLTQHSQLRPPVGQVSYHPGLAGQLVPGGGKGPEVADTHRPTGHEGHHPVPPPALAGERQRRDQRAAGDRVPEPPRIGAVGDDARRGELLLDDAHVGIG